MGISAKGSSRYRYFISIDSVQILPKTARPYKSHGSEEYLHADLNPGNDKQLIKKEIPKKIPAPKSQKGKSIIHMEIAKPRYLSIHFMI
jgi:hypothetical protein|tara:strand:+ start:274 stop:540 length:267 start_codon:yes stop_codon:yes gene_type:complete